MSKQKIKKLNVADRLGIIRVMPEKTNYTEFKVKSAVLDKVAITPEECKQWNIPLGSDFPITKELKLASEKDMSFTEFENDLISKHLRELEKGSELTALTGPLYEKFCK